ncbi:hypothetical protein CLV52_0314 [Amnibacterium kyonggiense]|uniref:Uncharacterized protein n=1 Tax=Amnibacterium kyonggiense TaxID=595671 RepID=A0A4R7FPT5_9MICO|nr:hypothetical protein CLV52_0314 [Amnibacterium kyonggiense]
MEIGVGGTMAFVGALVLVVHVGSIPGFVAELVIGFVSVAAFWPMLGGALLLALGLFLVVRGRRGVRRHRRAVERIEAMRAREAQRRLAGAGGVSAGVAGTPHRVPGHR